MALTPTSSRSTDAGGDSEAAYAETTSDVTVTATTEAGANVVVTAPEITADGATEYLIEFQAAGFRPGAVVGEIGSLWLFEDGSSIGRIGMHQAISGTTNNPIHVRCARKLTPAAGAHTYSIRASGQTGTSGLVVAGAGGAGASLPAFIRIVALA